MPYHSVYFHDDDAVERVFALDWPEFPHLTRMRQCVLQEGAMVIDVWRLFIMYQYGGVYTDIDNWPGPDMTESTIRPEANALFVTDPKMGPSHWYFAIEPGHPILYYTTIEVLSRLALMQRMEDPAVMYVTGPGTLDWGYLRFLNVVRPRRHGIGLYGLHNKTVDRISRADTPAFVAAELNGTMSEKLSDHGNTTKRRRIYNQMKITHWTKKGMRRRKGSATGSCLAQLYRMDSKEYES